MFDIAWTEMLVIAVVMIVVVGPKELPGMLRTIGKTTAKLRTMAGEFRKQFDDALKEAELDDLKKLADDARRLNPAADIKKAFNPLETAGKDVRAGLAAAFNPPKAEPPKPKAPEPAAVAPAAPAATPAAPVPAAAAAMPAAVKPKAPAKAKAPSKPAPAKPAPAKPVAKKAAAPKKKTGGAAS
ncbi:MAG TPA: Sec-independent protein translocase protein TatB [Aquamicrobium sp.]|nr:Sec-independent protein translocase protein TatB [Aquamicrobium sp.]